MAKIELSPNSYLNLSKLLEVQGVLFWDQVDLPEIPFSDEDEFIQVPQNLALRLDEIAYQKYGDPELMWAIMLANDLNLPNQLYEGQFIRIPAKATIDSLLDQAREQT